MGDLHESLSDTDGTAMVNAVESANKTTRSCAIAPQNPLAIATLGESAQKSANVTATSSEIAIAANPTIIAPAIPTGGNAYAPGSTNPYLVYLSQLAVGSRRTMRESLEHIARMVSEGSLDALNFPWSELRYQHTQAIYTHLLETRAPATANKMMAAVGRVLKEAWKLGQMSAED